MSSVTNKVLEYFGGTPLEPRGDRVFISRIKDKDFSFTRKSALERTQMLAKATPLLEMIKPILSSVLTSGIEVGQLKDAKEDLKKEVGIKSVDGIISAFSRIDERAFSSVIIPLIGWAKWKNTSTDKFEDISGHTYNKLFDDDLLLQVAILAAVIEVNFVPFSQSGLRE